MNNKQELNSRVSNLSRFIKWSPSGQFWHDFFSSHTCRNRIWMQGFQHSDKLKKKNLFPSITFATNIHYLSVDPLSLSLLFRLFSRLTTLLNRNLFSFSDPLNLDRIQYRSYYFCYNPQQTLSVVTKLGFEILWQIYSILTKYNKIDLREPTLFSKRLTLTVKNHGAHRI